MSELALILECALDGRGIAYVLEHEATPFLRTGGLDHLLDEGTPYAPELNPMENIWDYLRGNKFSRRVWDSYEAIVAACNDAWLFLVGDLSRIDTIAHRSWAQVNL